MADNNRDGGHYTCVAQNEVGNASRSYIVKITSFVEFFFNFILN